MIKKILIFLILTFTFLQIYYFKDFIVDDAYITFRYGKNLAEGKGIVFNEGERVEGATNFSFIIFSSLSHLLKIGPLLFVRIISILSVFLSYFLLYKITDNFLKKDEKLIPIFFLSLSAPYFYWAMAGLEAVFFSFTILFLVYLEIKEDKSFLYPLAHILTITARPEGFAVSGIIWIFRFFKKRDKLLRLFIPFILFTSVYLLFKLIYFGSIIPNTFYAKVMGPKMLGQTIIFLKNYPHFLIIVLIFLKLKKEFFLPLLITLFFLIYPQIFGGDIMPYFRFFVYILPLLVFLSSISILYIIKLKLLKNIILVLFIFSSLYTTIFSVDLVFAIMTDKIAKAGIYTGKFLKENLKEREVIALNAIGTIGYFSERPIIDMLGLCDKHISRTKASGDFKSFAIAPAHSKGDGIYVYKKNPEIIIMGNTAGSKKPVYTSDFQLLQMDGFKENYLLRKVVIIPKGEEKTYYFFSKNKKIYYNYPLFSRDFPKRNMFYLRMDIGTDIFIDLNPIIPKMKVKFYPFTFNFYAKKEIKFEKIVEGEAIFPPPLYPEEYYNAKDFQDAGIWSAAEGRYREAQYYLNKSLVLSNNFYTHFLLGKVYFLAGDIEDGIKEMEEALRQKPDLIEAKEEILKYKK